MSSIYRVSHSLVSLLHCLSSTMLLIKFNNILLFALILNIIKLDQFENIYLEHEEMKLKYSTVTVITIKNDLLKTAEISSLV